MVYGPVGRLVESTCIQAFPWAELIYVAAQSRKPRVCTHTILLGAVWLEMGERNHALTRPTIWFSLHTCTVHAHAQNALTPRHMHTHTHTWMPKTCAISTVPCHPIIVCMVLQCMNESDKVTPCSINSHLPWIQPHLIKPSVLHLSFFFWSFPSLYKAIKRPKKLFHTIFSDFRDTDASGGTMQLMKSQKVKFCVFGVGWGE